MAFFAFAAVGLGAAGDDVVGLSFPNDPYPLGNHAENNQNLRVAAGVRLVGAAASSITDSNITDNAFGVLNLKADGSTANTAVPVAATNNL